MRRKLGVVATLWSYCIGFLKLKSSLKDKYDALNSKWTDVDSILSTMTTTYQPFSKLYALDSNNAKCLV